jgi:chaperonin GroES
MKFKPLNRRVLVKLDEQKRQTESGIYIPESAQNDFSTGKVNAVGNEAVLVKAGDKIMFANTVGIDIEIDGETFRLIPDEAYIDAVI